MTSERVEAKLGFDRIRKAISDRCATDYAAARVESEDFSTDAAVIRCRLQLTDEMRLVLMFEDGFPTSGYIDCIGFLEPIADNASIDLPSLGKLRTLLDTIRRITHFFASIKDGVYPCLKRTVAPVKAFPDVLARIDRIIDRHGEVKDSASDELFSIRRAIRDKENSVSKRLEAILRRARAEGIVDADAGVSVRDGKMLIPVLSSRKRSLPGFVYDESSSGKTTFIEPAEIVEITNEIQELHFAESREIARILFEFSEFLRPYVPELLKGATLIGELDFVMAKAQVALDYIAGMPVISSSGELSLRKARHPLLEKALKREHKEIVPLSVGLNPSKHILLISGPNAGGKSVCLKTVGLLQYMFQWGMLIPTSETSELPVFDRIMVSIGDDQSIDNDLSTYSSFLADMREMLSSADSRTLVLIDEFGSGTEPQAGGAIAEAILSELDRRGVYGVITTHYTNLKLYASSTQTGVVNGAMLFDASAIAPLFQLETGLPGNSFAFELARKMGLPETIVHDAELRSGEEYVGIERNLRRIARSRRAIDERLQKIKATDKTLDSLTEKYQKELEELLGMRSEILSEARREAEEIIRGANREVEKTIRVIKETAAEKEATRAARSSLSGFLGAITSKKEEEERSRGDYLERKLKAVQKRQEKSRSRRPAVATGESDSEAARLEAFRSAPLKAGEKVRIKDNNMVGEVRAVSPKSVTVVVGNVVTKISPDRLERVTSNEYKAALKETWTPPLQKIDSSITERRLNFRPELDIRGARVAEALEAVRSFVEDAIMLDIGTVRILHGKGTGALREEIQKYLRTVAGVASVADEDIRRGGSGVTVVTLL